MTWVESLAPVHNIFYAVLPIIFWIYVFIYTEKKACKEGQTTFIMGVLAVLIVFMALDITYCSILLDQPRFKNDPNYTSIRTSIIVSLVMSVLGVAMSILNIFAIYRGTYCSTVERFAKSTSAFTERAKTAANDAKRRMSEAKKRMSGAVSALRGKQNNSPPSTTSSA
jgi:hypothetical protein